ncbi:hypothetical protein E4N87_02840 [Treponema denticola]|uniref:Lipoprotein n=1 Tax=Treponema denticola TaxID=158 RepID=A0A9Q9EZK1_TREDN|nr:hypothetical protein [Treponema denticola]UTC89684.1 hypothetical protein E4N87_02840 [Treponema denticola]UTD00965.1 hypothetical protein E4N86_09740 [Treponema denticola]
MKKLAFILALVGMLVGCSKHTEVSRNQSITRETETTTEVQNEPSTIVKNSTNVENVTETKTEETWIALIEKEITKISFNNGEYRLMPNDKEGYYYINAELKNGVNFYVQLIQKNYIDDSIKFELPETFQEYAKAVLSVSTLPQDLRTARGAVEVNGHKFARNIRVLQFAPDISMFQMSYYTTTPMYTLECTFLRGRCDEFKQEAPEYFEENGDWKKEMPSGETGDIEFAEKIVDGTIESKTARELYKISEDFMKTIEIKTVE